MTMIAWRKPLRKQHNKTIIALIVFVMLLFGLLLTAQIGQRKMPLRGGQSDMGATRKNECTRDETSAALISVSPYVNDEVRKFSHTNTASEDLLFVPRAAIHEIASCETPGETTLRETANRNANTGKLSFSRTNNENAFSALLFSFLCLCFSILFFCSQNISNSHQFIISYIHNLDGMKP
ncbi:MAG: hypothetical protein IJU50_05400 [Lachnospiraceae bacterium]|nr:hypothetical protein [Lachnospiraceae bacterium]